MIKRLATILLTTLMLATPQLALAQSQPAGVDFTYEIKPNETDTVVNNKASMQTTSEGTVTSNITCTQIGSTSSANKKCGGGSSGGSGSSGQLAGWPTDGSISQGPKGPFSHLGIFQSSKAMAIDIANAAGPPVYPTLTGTVKTIHQCNLFLDCNKSYGNFVEVADPAKQFSVLYGHLRVIDPTLQTDASVNRTTKLGIMGTTGFSTGTHLHWEFRGIEMAIPNIPMDIEPISCDDNCQLKDKDGKIYPANIRYDPNEVASGNGNQPVQDAYWFLLDRAQKVEYLYKGVPNDKTKSQLIKTSQVNVGVKNQYPTPLAQKVNGSNRPYWVVTKVRTTVADEVDSLGSYFIILDIPYANPNNGPTPYNECGANNTEQCHWATPGNFGLHGINGHADRLSDAGSSGCVRHSDADIEDLFNKLHNVTGEIRYYIEDAGA